MKRGLQVEIKDVVRLPDTRGIRPADLDGREKDGLTYPVAIYDHDEGRAVTDGFAYHGRIAALRGKFVFGDIQNGRLFAADLAELKKADDGIPCGNSLNERWGRAFLAPICISADLATASCCSPRDRMA